MYKPTLRLELEKCDLSVPSDGKPRIAYRHSLVIRTHNNPERFVALTGYCHTKKKAAQELVDVLKELLILAELL